MLRHGHLHPYMLKAFQKNEAAENYQAKVYYDPAYRLDSPVQTIINNINPDVGSLPDCQGYGQIRYPDKNISRQLLGPDGHASQAVKFLLERINGDILPDPGGKRRIVQDGKSLGNRVAIKCLVGDDENHQNQSRYQEWLFKILIQSAQETFFICGHPVLQFPLSHEFAAELPECAVKTRHRHKRHYASASPGHAPDPRFI